MTGALETHQRDEHVETTEHVTQIQSMITDDPAAIALQAAADMMMGRFRLLAECDGDIAAARRVTEVADVFVAWLVRKQAERTTMVRMTEPESTDEAAQTVEVDDAEDEEAAQVDDDSDTPPVA